ncbi:MAG: HK97 gp10 family phage protein [Parvularculaceae bacterium]
MPWDTDIGAELDDMQRELEDEVKAGAMVIAEGLNRYTPVDTGRLVGNWQAGINTDPPDVRLPDDPSRSFSIVYLEAAIEQFSLGDSLVFANFTPYASLVNDGAESREPRRFLERAIEDAVNYFGGEAA